MSLAVAAESPPIRVDPAGVARVGDSRVRLASIVFRYRQGATPEEIQQSFPSVSLPDVYAVVAYYLRHRSEVDDYLADLDAEAERIRAEVESRPETRALRERLQARRK